jgi:hypothetical protein
MMGAEMVAQKSVIFNKLTRLIVRLDITPNNALLSFKITLLLRSDF